MIRDNRQENGHKKKVKRRAFIAAGISAGGGLVAGVRGDAAENAARKTTTASNEAGGISCLFLGTGAADWPAHYPVREYGLTAAREAFRGNASMLMGGTMLIDCGPTVAEALAYHSVDAAAINDILLTHTHGDHLSAVTLETVAKAHAIGSSATLWAEIRAVERIPAVDGIAVKPLVIGTTVTIGDYTVTPLAANHLVQNSPETALHFLIERGGKRLFYATDGAWLPKPTWLALRETKLDAVVWDATIGDTEGDWRIFEHNSIAMIRLMTETLNKQNVLAPGAKTILTHLARTLCSPHDELERKLAPEGMIPSWDGLSLTV